MEKPIDLLKKPPVLFLLHAGLAPLVNAVPLLATIWSLGILAAGVYTILSNPSAKREVFLYAAYIVGMEVMLRMLKAGPNYEFGKYSLIVLFGTSLLVERKGISFGAALFLFALIPSTFLIDFGDFRENFKHLSFNLTGPVSIIISYLYFRNRKLSLAQLGRMLRALCLPITTLVVLLFLRDGSLSAADFTLGSSYKASGGFGPNQVSTLLGAGILAVLATWMLNRRMTGYFSTDIILIGLCAYRALLTFSRGGFIVPFLCFMIAGLWLLAKAPKEQTRGLKTVFNGTLLLAPLIFLSWELANQLTGNYLEKRYSGETTETDFKGKYNYYSGRDQIFTIDLQMFADNPVLGVGPGMGLQYRDDYGFKEVSAHVEYTRLLAEHGLFGIICIGFLFLAPVRQFNRQTKSRLMLLLFTSFSLITMVHSATRLSLVAFMFGLGFCCLQFFRYDAVRR